MWRYPLKCECTAVAHLQLIPFKLATLEAQVNYDGSTSNLQWICRIDIWSYSTCYWSRLRKNTTCLLLRRLAHWQRGWMIGIPDGLHNPFDIGEIITCIWRYKNVQRNTIWLTTLMICVQIQIATWINTVHLLALFSTQLVHLYMLFILETACTASSTGHHKNK